MWSEAQTLVTSGPDIAFNAGAGSDCYYLITSECRWVPDVRVTSDPMPRGDGAIIFPTLLGAGHLFIGGVLLPASDTAAARDAMAYNLEAAFDALIGSTGSYQQPSGRGTLTVTAETYPGFADWQSAYRKSFAFTLIAAGPGWT
jgi:hypothetical protein